MTKRFVIFALLLMAAMGMQAQSLNGTWNTTVNNDGQNTDMYFIFSQSSLSIKGVVTQSEPEVGTFTISILVPGTYTRSGNKLNIKLKPEQGRVNIDKMVLNDELKKILEEMPEMKKELAKGLEQVLSEGKSELVKEFSALSGDMNIESLTATKLILVDEGGGTLTFTRVR